METEKLNPGQMGVKPNQWVDLYGNDMYRYALARLPDPETAQDLVQEALVAAIGAYKQFQGKSSIKTWLIAILKRKIVDHYRRLSHRQNIEEFDTVTDNEDRLFNESGHWKAVPDKWKVDPQSALEQKEFMDLLYRCIAKLPARLADIFMLREFDEMNTKTICRLMDITESNTWVMLYRARMNLRTCLTDNWLSGDR